MRYALALALAATASAAQADVPRGKRAHRPAANRVVVEQTECATGRGTPIVLRPGVAVAAARPRRGTVKVELLGDVSGRCRVPAETLGLRLARDARIAIDGAEVGDIYAGALVRPRPDGTVETAGATRSVFELPADALTAEPREFVYRAPPAQRFVTPFADTVIYHRPASVGTNAPALATIDAGVEVVLLEQRGSLAKVRTHGPVEVEGWGLNKQFADRGAPIADATLLKPTHEVYTGAPLYPDASGSKPIATLRGGTLVEVNDRGGARAKITTVGDAIATGWVPRAELRELVTD